MSACDPKSYTGITADVWTRIKAAVAEYAHRSSHLPIHRRRIHRSCGAYDPLSGALTIQCLDGAGFFVTCDVINGQIDSIVNERSRGMKLPSAPILRAAILDVIPPKHVQRHRTGRTFSGRVAGRLRTGAVHRALVGLASSRRLRDRRLRRGQGILVRREVRKRRSARVRSRRFLFLLRRRCRGLWSVLMAVHRVIAGAAGKSRAGVPLLRLLSPMARGPAGIYGDRHDAAYRR